MYQYDVYGGVLCGIPADPEFHFIEATRSAKLHFPNHGMPPLVLEPVFHTGKVLRRREGEEREEAWEILPAVCTIAEFESNEPARDDYETYSSVVVIWYQDGYGLPDDPRTEEKRPY